jgi:hypothetical protein
MAMAANCVVFAVVEALSELKVPFIKAQALVFVGRGLGGIYVVPSTRSTDPLVGLS